jgi:hypothetical protein
MGAAHGFWALAGKEGGNRNDHGMGIWTFAIAVSGLWCPGQGS